MGAGSAIEGFRGSLVSFWAIQPTCTREPTRTFVNDRCLKKGSSDMGSLKVGCDSLTLAQFSLKR